MYLLLLLHTITITERPRTKVKVGFLGDRKHILVGQLSVDKPHLGVSKVANELGASRLTFRTLELGRFTKEYQRHPALVR